MGKIVILDAQNGRLSGIFVLTTIGQATSTVMENLKENWLTDGLMDFEYKKYVLLAYLKHVKDSFTRVELYPFLSDLVFHYRNLITLRESKSLMTDQFPKQLSLENVKNLEINYKKMIKDDVIMQEIESIIQFSLPRLKKYLDEGSFIYEYVQSNCEITPIGLTALYAKEGYLFISQPPEKEIEIYRYQMTIFDNSNEILRAIHTKHVVREAKTISNSYEQMKLKLIRDFSDLPNPATYLVVSKLKFPFLQTLMPVAKRLLVKQISKAA